MLVGRSSEALRRLEGSDALRRLEGSDALRRLFECSKVRTLGDSDSRRFEEIRRRS